MGVIANGLYFTVKPIDPAFPGSLYLLALLASYLGCIVRYWTVVDYYDGASDAPLYHQHGLILAQYFKVFDFSIMDNYVVRGEGTTQLAYVTGFVYSLLPVSMAGAFFFFAMLAFVGSVIFYCAVRVAWPEAEIGYYRLASSFCLRSSFGHRRWAKMPGFSFAPA
ncbi:MAG: hypothetical protein R2867_16940 [Caldilineaceae bacterium]